MFGPLFLGGPSGRRLFRGRQAPTTAFAVQTLVLLFPGNGWRPLHAKDLVHRLSSRDIVAGKPPFTVHRAGIFVFAPIRIFRWVYIDCPSHALSFLRCGPCAVQ